MLEALDALVTLTIVIASTNVVYLAFMFAYTITKHEQRGRSAKDNGEE